MSNIPTRPGTDTPEPILPDEHEDDAIGPAEGDEAPGPDLLPSEDDPLPSDVQPEDDLVGSRRPM